MHRWIIGAVVAAILLAGCGSTRSALSTSPSTATSTTSPALAVATKEIVYQSVAVAVPATWPVIDGAHVSYGCSFGFAGQADRAFLGDSNQAALSCGVPAPSLKGSPVLADGVWMSPGGSTPPPNVPTTLPRGQVIYPDSDASAGYVAFWYHGVSVRVGIGPDPGVERAILDSLTYRPNTADTPVLGQCPPTDPSPPTMPTPSRATAKVDLPGSFGQLQPEPANVQPQVSPATAWTSLFQEFGPGGFSGPLQWSITFGSYFAQVPQFQDIPAWLIEGAAANTAYGSCDITVLAPYNADTGVRIGGVMTLG